MVLDKALFLGGGRKEKKQQSGNLSLVIQEHAAAGMERIPTITVRHSEPFHRG
jgi:hypothetical protein